eukprot:3715731-Rhodomonas_salina.1
MRAAGPFTEATLLDLESSGAVDGSETDVRAMLHRDMILEDRIAGSIDQIDGMIYFEQGSEAVRQWDAEIAGSCRAAHALCQAGADMGPGLAMCDDRS